MFKKTLVAAAIVACVSTPAFAKVNFDFTNAAWNSPTVLATVTKQTVLDLTTAAVGQDLLMTIDNPAAPDNELRSNGALVIRINGDASFNNSEIRQWLSNAAVDGVFNNLEVKDGAGAVLKTKAEVIKFFKLTSDGQKETLDYTIDENGKRLRIALSETADALAANSQINLLMSKATNAFKLQKGSLSTVTLDVGVIQNASYTSDPQVTKPLFKMDKLFALESVTQGKATALVSEKFLKYATPAGTVVTDADIAASAKLKNLTSNQNIQKAQVKLTLEGDFAAFSKNTDGVLLQKDGTPSGWKVTGNVAERLLGANGVVAGQGEEAIPAFLYAKPTNETAIEAQRLTLKAVQDGTSATFETFEDTLADLFIITRDGLKFDTITTGTTSANTIHIRDISDILPEAGGKIYVTIVQYGEHGVNGKAPGEVLVKRSVLSTTLPSGGAVTLKPSEVAAEVGADMVAGRQARFVFEVETNRGEVAVKKSNAEGVDIQNGTKGVEDLVDFTL
ncbi:VapA family S-layer protein [Aeromonas salmonicida]|uniref:VapA family S-layer protein n=1 Tax=Aeromonas salmonicida TaxID=645 RepID=UPI00259E0A6F|nr:S-layer protein [Aeromonas salmonicida]MDM5101383.1 S-layer protein [Aeromonas salmonicida]